MSYVLIHILNHPIPESSGEVQSIIKKEACGQRMILIFLKPGRLKYEAVDRPYLLHLTQEGQYIKQVNHDSLLLTK